jgi:hypothetical protein
MTTIRHRLTIAALTLAAAGLTACANTPTSPLDGVHKVSAAVDSTGRTPTLPWADVTTTTPTLPWH